MPHCCYLQERRRVKFQSAIAKQFVETLKKWRDTVPKEFLFTVKASRYITHRKKLKDSRATLSKLLERVGVKEEKLAVILFQLPPRWSVNEERLKDFVAVLPKDYRYAFEWERSQLV
ncbi:MAG: DUF72 domain-containing protein [Prochloraceae cyanobacterium]|nr:DUF72 domain-containing protein [Prochloraceae cyanobacterium]